MSECCRRLHKFLRTFDLFSASQFLRYRGESEYSTATGGCTSLVVIGLFIGLFAAMGLETAKKDIINSSVSVSYELDPTPVKTKTAPDSAFLFAFNMMGINLNDPTVTYFDFTLTQTFYGPNFALINQTVVPLEPCTA